MIIANVFISKDNPFLWFDEATFINATVNGVSPFHFIFPGVVEHYYGGQSLVFFFNSLIIRGLFFLPPKLIYMTLNSISLFFIFVEGEKISKLNNGKSQSYLSSAILIFSSAILLFYLNDFKPYLIEVCLSLYILRRFLQNKLEKISTFLYILIPWISLQATFTIFAANLTEFCFRRNKDEIVKTIVFLFSIGIYFFMIKTLHPHFIDFMHEYWEKRNSMGLQSYSILFNRLQNLFLAGIPYKNICTFITALMILVIGYKYLKKFTVFIFVLIISLFFTSVIKKYPVSPYIITGIELDLRPILFLVVIMIFYYGSLIDKLSKKYSSLLMFFVIFVSFMFHFEKEKTTYQLVNVSDSMLQENFVTMMKIKTENNICIYNNAYLLYQGNVKANLVMPRKDFIDFRSFIRDSNERSCKVLVIEWEVNKFYNEKNIKVRKVTKDHYFYLFEVTKI